MRPADRLQLKNAKFLPLVAFARFKQDPMNRGHGAEYMYRPPPARARLFGHRNTQAPLACVA